jgi:hypothetical protein
MAVRFSQTDCVVDDENLKISVMGRTILTPKTQNRKEFTNCTCFPFCEHQSNLTPQLHTPSFTCFNPPWLQQRTPSLLSHHSIRTTVRHTLQAVTAEQCNTTFFSRHLSSSGKLCHAIAAYVVVMAICSCIHSDRK